MDDTYLEKLRKWIDLDNQTTRLKSQLAELGDEKKEVEDEIIEYIKANSLDKVTVNVADGTLKFAKRSSQQAMSRKYLKTTLMKYNEEQEPINTDAVLQYLVTNLETQTKMFIKRDVT
jgi:UDP-N-acetylmuramyl pentapeptide synthase